MRMRNILIAVGIVLLILRLVDLAIIVRRVTSPAVRQAAERERGEAGTEADLAQVAADRCRLLPERLCKKMSRFIWTDWERFKRSIPSRYTRVSMAL